MAEQINSARSEARTVRIAPRKARLVVDLIPRSASPIVKKVLKSAIANAEHNYDLESANLYVSEAYVNEGPTLKRFRPRAKGSASPINKRTSHVVVKVSVKND
ncbi:MAG: 50S ribosomal protein L22 [Lactobacillus iners]|nr:50S ribosomal protein L22 [Lactobacillus iners]